MGIPTEILVLMCEIWIDWLRQLFDKLGTRIMPNFLRRAMKLLVKDRIFVSESMSLVSNNAVLYSTMIHRHPCLGIRILI